MYYIKAKNHPSLKHRYWKAKAIHSPVSQIVLMSNRLSDHYLSKVYNKTTKYHKLPKNPANFNITFLQVVKNLIESNLLKEHIVKRTSQQNLSNFAETIKWANNNYLGRVKYDPGYKRSVHKSFLVYKYII